MNKQKPFECDLKTYEGYIARKEYWDDLSTEWSFSTKEEKIIRLGGFVQQGGSLLRLLNRYAKEHDERYRERIQYCVLSYLRELITGGFTDDYPICNRIKCLDKKELVELLKIELKSRVRKSSEIESNGEVSEIWIIDKENIDSAKPEFTDSVLLDKIQIPYWRAHPEVSITSYESRIQIHWNGAYAKSLW